MPGVTIVGLGPGDPDLLTVEARRIVDAATEVHTSAVRHAALATLPPSAAVIPLEMPPEAIVQAILEMGRRPQGVVFAVPGHPLVGDAVAAALLDACRREGLPCRIVAGVSLLDAVCEALSIDAVAAGVQLVDPSDPRPDPARPTVVAPLSGASLPPGLRDALLDLYPPDHAVVVVSTAVSPPRRHELPLGDLGEAALAHGPCCLYLPALPPEHNFRTFGGLEGIVHRLRAPGGCPWDRAQTHESLRRFLLEEAYETLAALDEGDPAKLREELGDLLLQVLLHTEIASESGEFRLADAVEGIGRKLVRRHPHVFGDVKVETPEQVVDNWEAIKRDERDERGDTRPLLADVPAAMPAIAYSQALQTKAGGVGFQWPDVESILEKLVEELEELSKAEDAVARRDEMGDVLFVLTSVARRLDVDAEEALRLAARKFRERFTRLEELARERGSELADLTLPEMEALWQEAKGLGSSLDTSADEDAGRPSTGSEAVSKCHFAVLFTLAGTF
jgi:tetrapyrrole methylase family protein/MazG family protein